MKYSSVLIAICFISMFNCCKNETEPEWLLDKNINIDDFEPVGISCFKQYICISDSSKDKVYFVDSTDYSLFLNLDIESPVYINIRRLRLLAPSYNKDSVYIFRGSGFYPLETFGILDGPVAADANSIWNYLQVSQNDHRIHYRDTIEYVIGGKGTESGKFNTPSNAMFIDSLIFVVDSGNKRIQVFNNMGEFYFSFGEELLMQWPTGIAASDSSVFVSDAIQNEIYIFDKKGKYLSSIKNGIDGPSDIEYYEERLYVANLKGPDISILKRK